MKNAGIKLTVAQLRKLIKKNYEKRTGTKVTTNDAGKKPRGRPKGSATSSPTTSPKLNKPRVNNMTKSKLNKCLNNDELYDICDAHKISTSGTKEDKAASISKFWKENPDEITKDLTKEMIKNVVVKLALAQMYPTKLAKSSSRKHGKTCHLYIR